MVRCSLMTITTALALAAPAFAANDYSWNTNAGSVWSNGAVWKLNGAVQGANPTYPNVAGDTAIISGAGANGVNLDVDGGWLLT